MAIRVEPDANIIFGVMVAAQTITHARFRKTGDTGEAVVRPLSASLSVPAGNRLRIPATMFDVVYPDGQLSRAHMKGVVEDYWTGTEMQIDCMTSSSAVVSDTGYSQQTHDSWTITEENDS